MGRLRKPDALSPAERQRRHKKKLGFVTLRVPPEGRDLLNEISRLAEKPKTHVLLELLRCNLAARRTEVAIRFSSAPQPGENAPTAVVISKRRRTPTPSCDTEPDLLSGLYQTDMAADS
jgi:hypothetical protein